MNSLLGLDSVTTKSLFRPVMLGGRYVKEPIVPCYLCPVERALKSEK